MLKENIYKYWLEFSGLEEQVANFNKGDLDAVNRKLQQVFELESEDKIRTLLAEMSNEESLDLCILMIRRVLERGMDADADQQLNTLDWASLFSSFSGLAPAAYFETNINFLIAFTCFFSGRGDEAQKALINGLNTSTSEGIPALISSFFYFFLAEIENRRNNQFKSLDYFDQALEKINIDDSPQRQNWFDFVEERKDRDILLSDLIEKIIAEEEEWDEVKAYIRENVAHIDKDFFHQALFALFQVSHTGDIQKAIRIAQSFEKIGPLVGQSEANDYLYTLGYVLFDNNHYTSAISVLEVFLTTAPANDRSEVLDILMECYFHTGSDTKGQDLALQLIEIEPQNHRPYRHLGLSYLRENKLEEAYIFLSKALELKPDDPMTKLALQEIGYKEQNRSPFHFDQSTGTLTIGMGDYEKADPEQMALEMSAAILGGIDPSELPEILESIAQDRGPDYVKKLLALMSRDQGSVQGADHELTTVEKAKQFFAARDLDQAKIWYQKAIEEDINNAYAYMGLGDCHYMQGAFYLAAAYFEESIEIEPSPSTYRFLGDAYIKTNRLDDAIEIYKKIVREYPDYPMGNAALNNALTLKEREKNV